MLENARRQFILVLLTIVAGLVCIFTLEVPLGTDLRGGTQLRYEVSNIRMAFGSEDGKEARRAFLEKRKPVFTGT